MSTPGAGPEEDFTPPRLGTWLLLLAGSLVVTGVILWALIGPTGLPVVTSLLIAVMFLFTDLVALLMLWYVSRGGSDPRGFGDEQDPWAD